jgi:hypothetical protein
MQFLEQSLESWEEKLGVICTSNLNCKSMANKFPTKLKSLNQGSNMKINILQILDNLKLPMKSRKGLNTIATYNHMLAPSCFTLMHMSISCATSTFVCNINLSLESWTYNLIVEARALDNNQ